MTRGRFAKPAVTAAALAVAIGVILQADAGAATNWWSWWTWPTRTTTTTTTVPRSTTTTAPTTTTASTTTT
ncbi:MAG: hypothetical protein ACOYOP_15510, partial [Microthrixaceae bacterium]